MQGEISISFMISYHMKIQSLNVNSWINSVRILSAKIPEKISKLLLTFQLKKYGETDELVWAEMSESR